MLRSTAMPCGCGCNVQQDGSHGVDARVSPTPCSPLVRLDTRNRLVREQASEAANARIVVDDQHGRRRVMGNGWAVVSALPVGTGDRASPWNAYDSPQPRTRRVAPGPVMCQLGGEQGVHRSRWRSSPRNWRHECDTPRPFPPPVPLPLGCAHAPTNAAAATGLRAATRKAASPNPNNAFVAPTNSSPAPAASAVICSR